MRVAFSCDHILVRAHNFWRLFGTWRLSRRILFASAQATSRYSRLLGEGVWHIGLRIVGQVIRRHWQIITSSYSTLSQTVAMLISFEHNYITLTYARWWSRAIHPTTRSLKICLGLQRQHIWRILLRLDAFLRDEYVLNWRIPLRGGRLGKSFDSKQFKGMLITSP